MLSLISPAKINLFLHIIGQRSDGYHNLETIFQLLDFGDTLSFSERADKLITLTSNYNDIPRNENLIIKAAELLRRETGIIRGCNIRVNKVIPMGAGLGGGSSNSATTLLVLNSLWNCGLSLDKLSDLGQTLGADIPVFIKGNTSFAESTGEILSPLNLPKKWFLVITPSCSISTQEIFSHPQLTRNSSPIKIRALPSGQCRNDCQKVVINEYPEVRDVLDWAANFAEPLLTGTGSSVFCKFDNQEEARRVLIEVPKKWKGFVAKGINRSSVQQQVKDYFNGASPSG